MKEKTMNANSVKIRRKFVETLPANSFRKEVSIRTFSRQKSNQLFQI
jgi:hypothetical protein